MDLISAAKSGRPFRRPAFAKEMWLYKEKLPDMGLRYEDIVADDWETEETDQAVCLIDEYKKLKRRVELLEESFHNSRKTVQPYTINWSQTSGTSNRD